MHGSLFSASRCFTNVVSHNISPSCRLPEALVIYCKEFGPQSFCYLFAFHVAGLLVCGNLSRYTVFFQETEDQL